MKKRYIFHFPPEAIGLPITYTLVKNFDIKVNILNADLSSGKSGKLVMEIEAKEKGIADALEFIKNKKIECSELTRQLTFNNEACIACGACTAVCFSGALVLDNDSWQLSYNNEDCVICGLCVKACPLQLFDLELEHYV